MTVAQTSTWLGLMSGSSLDGLDIAVVRFTWINDLNSLSFPDWQILHSRKLDLPDIYRNQLQQSPSLTGKDLIDLHSKFGDFCGHQIANFLKEFDLKIDGVGFHGHTVFHFPDLGFSFQLGLKEQIKKHLEVPVFTDFRNDNIAKGGQGTPLVPIMEHYLLKDFNIFLNLGGIANISFHDKNQITAYDVSPCNQLLNYVAKQIGEEFDRNGELASKGTIDSALMLKLNNFNYYKRALPKSLDNNVIRDYFLPLLNDSLISVEAKLHTLCFHISKKIAESVAAFQPDGVVYCTGGGTHNQFLIDCLNLEAQNHDFKLIIPNKQVIDYKEAVLMALLGLLKYQKLPWYYSDL